MNVLKENLVGGLRKTFHVSILSLMLSTSVAASGTLSGKPNNEPTNLDGSSVGEINDIPLSIEEAKEAIRKQAAGKLDFIITPREISSLTKKNIRELKDELGDKKVDNVLLRTFDTDGEKGLSTEELMVLIQQFPSIFGYTILESVSGANDDPSLEKTLQNYPNGESENLHFDSEEESKKFHELVNILGGDNLYIAYDIVTKKEYSDLYAEYCAKLNGKMPVLAAVILKAKEGYIENMQEAKWVLNAINRGKSEEKIQARIERSWNRLVDKITTGGDYTGYDTLYIEAPDLNNYLINNLGNIKNESLQVALIVEYLRSEEKLRELNDELGEYKARMKKMKEHLKQLDEDIKKIDGSIEQLDEDIKKIEKKIEEYKTISANYRTLLGR